MPRRDLAWRDNDVVWAIAGVTPPEPAEIIDALKAAASTGRAGHFLRLLDIEQGRSGRPQPSQLAAFCDALVLQFDEPYNGDLARLAVQAQRRPLGELPFQFSRGPDWCTLHFSHALGDAVTVWPLFLGLVQPRILSTLAPREPRPVRPLAKALWHVARSKPSALVTMIRAPRPPMPLAPDKPGTYVEPDLAIESQISDTGFLPAFNAWRKEKYPAATSAAVVAMRVAQAASDIGLELCPGLVVAADARRYLPLEQPGAQYSGGNFTAGAYVPVGDWNDPDDLSKRVAAFAGSGRPLLTIAAMSVTTRRRRRPRAGWLPDPQGRTLLSYSHVGKLPWLTQGPTDAIVVAQPIGDRGLGVVVHEMDGRMYASVSYDRRHLDGDDIRRLTEAILAYP